MDEGWPDIGHMIGISTLPLRGMPLERAIDVVYEEGFQVFELVPHLYGGPERFDQSMRRNLRDRLSCFETVTVHSSGAKLREGRRVNIASSQASYRRESIEHYLEHVQLALDLGAKVATFHPGYGDEKASPADVREAHRIFAQTASERAKDSNLQMGYEYFDVELTKDIGQPQFGILFDIGHAALQSEGDLNAGILQLMQETFPFIVQFHVHGVHVSGQGNKRDHQPFQANNGVDYARVLRAIKEQGFRGPLVFEIGVAEQSAAENLSNSVHAREQLIAIWSFLSGLP
jgi:sugar phosphate isomerase/epimerase